MERVTILLNKPISFDTSKTDKREENQETVSIHTYQLNERLKAYGRMIYKMLNEDELGKY